MIIMMHQNHHRIRMVRFALTIALSLGIRQSVSFGDSVSPTKPATSQPNKRPPAVLKELRSMEVKCKFSVRGVAFEPDGISLVSGWNGHIAREWSVAHGTEVQ